MFLLVQLLMLFFYSLNSIACISKPVEIDLDKLPETFTIEIENVVHLLSKNTFSWQVNKFMKIKQLKADIGSKSNLNYYELDPQKYPAKFMLEGKNNLGSKILIHVVVNVPPKNESLSFGDIPRSAGKSQSSQGKNLILSSGCNKAAVKIKID